MRLKVNFAPLERNQRFIFGAMILGGYLLMMGTIAWFPIPKENQQIFAQAVGTLGTAVGVIVAALWKGDDRPRDTPEDDE